MPLNPERSRARDRAPIDDTPLGYRTGRKGGFTVNGNWDHDADWNSPRRKFVQRLVNTRRSTEYPPAKFVEIIMRPEHREYRPMFDHWAIALWMGLETFEAWSEIVEPYPGAENAATASVRFCGNSGVGQEEGCIWYRGWYKPARFFGELRDRKISPGEGTALRVALEEACASWDMERAFKSPPVLESQQKAPEF